MNSRATILYCLFLCLAEFTPGIIFGQKTSPIKLSLSVGQVLDYAFSSRTKESIDYKIGINDEVNTLNVFRLKVLKIDSSGDYQLECFIYKMKVDENVPFIGDIIYNSDSDFKIDHESPAGIFEDQFKNAFLEVVNKPFLITLSPSSKVIQVDGVDQFISKAIDSLNNLAGLSKKDKSIAIANLESTFTNKIEKDNFNDYFDLYPNRLWQNGVQWPIHRFYWDPDTSKDNYMLTVNKIGNDTVFLSFSGTVYGSGSSTLNGITTSSSGTSTGTAIIDEKTGLVLEWIADQKVSGTMVVDDQIVPRTSTNQYKEQIFEK